MLYSRHLLNQWISLNVSPQDIAQQLILRSCEIEHTYDNTIPELVVIGYVTEVVKHPQADTLYVCQVDCGPRGVFQIITGGENIVAQARVPVALPGCYLPVVDLTIGSRTMRGIESHGMICSKEELGIKEDTDKHWIWLLSQEFDDLHQDDRGISLSVRYPWLTSPAWEVDNKTITHRPDMTGHLGLAIELKTMYSLIDPQRISFQSVDTVIDELSRASIMELSSHARRPSLSVNVITQGCHSYQLFEIAQTSVKSSSFYTRRLLGSADGSPKNNWVDFSNLWMLKTGQPIHCFDADRIQGDIVVRDAQEGELFVDLTGKQHMLTVDDIVIADQDKILALAGVIGGQSSAVIDTTTRIMIEMAHFDAVRVRKTALRLANRTDASMRFEKALNPLCSVRFVPLLFDEIRRAHKDLCLEADVSIAWSCWMSDQVSTLLQSPPVIKVDIHRLLTHIHGSAITPAHQEQAYQILLLLGCGVNRTDTQWLVTPPRWRGTHDIVSVQDLTEEIARMSGYGEIAPLPSYHPMSPLLLDPLVRMRRSMEEMLSYRYHAQQVETYPRHHIKDAHILGQDVMVKLENPTAPEYESMRNTMIPNLLRVVEKNQAFFDRMVTYDIGQVWTSQGERTQLGIVYYAPRSTIWNQDTFLLIKEIVDGILSHLELIQALNTTVDTQSLYHPKKALSYRYQDSLVGFVAQLHPLQQSHWNIDETGSVSIARLDLNELISVPSTGLHRQRYYSLQDQIIIRDLNFVVSVDQSFETLLDSIKTTPQVDHVEVFDIYQGEKLPADKKSLACRLSILPPEGKITSMTTDDINMVMNHAIDRAQSVGAILRKDFTF